MSAMLALALAVTTGELNTPPWLASFGLRRAEWQRPAACGPNSVFLLLNCYGVKVNHRDVLLRMPLGEKGASLQELCDEGFRCGLPLKAVEATPSSLDSLELPVIVHFGHGSVGHYSVIVKIDEDYVHLIDGTYGSLQRQQRAHFEQDWSGFLIMPDRSELIQLDIGICISGICLLALAYRIYNTRIPWGKAAT